VTLYGNRRPTTLLLTLCTALIFAAFGCTQVIIEGGDGDDDDDDTEVTSRLFVVNDGNDTVTSYDTDEGLDGEQLPLTNLEAGSDTSLFQPRDLVVTDEGILFVSRQNGGIVGYDPAEEADLDQPAARVIEGSATLLNQTLSLAVDPALDVLFVGESDASHGILRFDAVSDSSFDGDVPPAAMFNPPDRAPSDVAPMTIDAMVLDDEGNLFVSDSSGSNINSSRILVFADAASADGETMPLAVITSAAWGGIEDLAFHGGSLYIVDGSDIVYRLDHAATLDGDVVPDVMFTFGVLTSSFRGIEVSADGTGYVSDSGEHTISTFFDISSFDGPVEPDAVLEGTDTDLFTPRHMFLVEPH